MAVTDDRESRLGSRLGACAAATESSKRSNDPILTHGGSDQVVTKESTQGIHVLQLE